MAKQYEDDDYNISFDILTEAIQKMGEQGITRQEVLPFLRCILPSHHRPFLHCAAALIAKPHKLVKDSY